MGKSLSFNIYFLIAFILQLIANKNFAQDSYVVSIKDIKSRRVEVQARLFPNSDTILMSPFGANHLKEGWATYVKNLEAKNKLNNKITIQPIGGGAFVLYPYNKGEEINLEYSVNIIHDKGKWPFGYKEAAYVIDSMMVLAGNAIFISRLDMNTATVRFDIPENFRVTNAWKQIAANTYKVFSPTELVWTVLAVGQYNFTKIISGKTEIELVYSSKLRASNKIISSTIKAAVKKYEKIYNGKPVTSSKQSDKFVYVMNVDSNYIGGGAAFTNSISIMLHEPPSLTHKTSSTTSWHHILIHEIGHLWNGQSLKTEEQNEWFTEGFTDYLAYKVEYDLNLFSENEWENMIKLKQEEYDKAFKEGLSIKDAGNNKSENYDLVYSGGLLFAKFLDAQIQNNSLKKKNINNFLQLLYNQFALANKAFVLNDIIAAFKAICNCEIKSIFEYLVTSKKLPHN